LRGELWPVVLGHALREILLPLAATFRMTRGRWRIVTALVASLATAAVVSTYPVFSQTWDEPATLATGMEWLSTGRYQYEAEHPPLARIAAALGPWLRGERTLGNHSMYDEGRALLGEGAHYRRTLFLARLGMLPFLWLLLAGCAVWGARSAGPPGAALATLFAAANPNVLAHAGVAGTDLAPAAFVVVALYLWMRWREHPSRARALALGVAAGLAATTKFSALAFLGLAIVLGELLRARWPEREPAAAPGPWPWRSALAAALAGALVVWAVNRFHVGPVGTHGVPVPAPELVRGLGAFLAHGSAGHPAFLLGEVRTRGWWYYYLVVLAVKTPLPLLALAVAGSAYAWRARRTEGWVALVPLAGVAAVLLPALASHVDLGVRIVLAVYPFVAVLAARGAVRAWSEAGSRARRRARRAAVALLVLAVAVVPVRAWPDYLAYFNAAAGPRPERVLVDSNLDWGQDLYRLADTVRARRIDSLRVHYFGSANLSAVGLANARRLGRDERTMGWVAASETFLAGVWSDTSLRWLARRQPVTRIGPSMRLYFIAPDPGAPARGGAGGSRAP
jgi:4-amino-4-deoxy-L-arabinose transferase-like glycosyltransferase